MTALKEYQRLECTGLWKETSDSQRREVLVSFGENIDYQKQHIENIKDMVGKERIFK